MRTGLVPIRPEHFFTAARSGPRSRLLRGGAEDVDPERTGLQRCAGAPGGAQRPVEGPARGGGHGVAPLRAGAPTWGARMLPDRGAAGEGLGPEPRTGRRHATVR